ncbi:MAG TPA: glycosyltransferase family 2 protein [Verrucomicrobiae bacterium]|jgi:glycosyltransferase involved in cell wall biosynthesis
MKPPKVSVLIPVYNGETYLAECLQSILNQDFQDMEILIADNCSTDRTVDIIKLFAQCDNRIRWWTNSSNLGCYGNSNACLQQAKGQFIKFVYADDLLISRQALKKMVEVFEAHPNVALVASATQMTDGQSKFTSIWNPQGISGLTNGRKVIFTCLEKKAKSNNEIGCPSATMFRRQYATRGFDLRFSYMGDTEMWFHLLEQGDFYWFSEPLAAFRIHSQQGSEELRQPDFKNYDCLLLLKTMLEKSWFRKQAADRLLFSQIYYKRKIFGNEARPLISEMRSYLPLYRYFFQWVVHKLYRPLEKLSHYLSPDRLKQKLSLLTRSTKNRHS